MHVVVCRVFNNPYIKKIIVGVRVEFFLLNYDIPFALVDSMG